MPVRAIDVSRWQGAIDWRQVAASGVAGAWIKVGGADAGRYKDSRAFENMFNARGVLPFGTYYFSQPAVGQAEVQAQHAVQCGHGDGELWPMLDLETNPHGLSRRQLDEFASQFCDEVMRLTGRESILYCGVGTGVGWTDAAPACPLWIANYGMNRAGITPPSFAPALPARWSSWSIWQFNSTTRVPGIAGNTVDQNVVTDEFWGQMLGGASMVPVVREEWRMKAIMVDGEETQYRVVTDGFGRDRRCPMPNPAYKAVLEKAGAVDQTDVVVLSDPDEVAAFKSIPVSNAEYTADLGALVLAGETVRQVNEHTNKAAAGGQVEVAADAILDELADRLTPKT